MKSLYDKGIKYIYDLLDQNGHIFEHGFFQQKYHVQVNFLTYFSLVSSIPREWKIILINNIQHLEHHTSTYFGRISALNGKVSKYTYRLMMENKTPPNITGVIKWEGILRNEDFSIDLWKNRIVILYRITKNTQLIQFQYKLAHYIVATKEKLFQWNISENDICRLCEEEIETVEHVFLECEVVKLFWIDIERFVNAKFAIQMTLTKVEKIFGVENQDLDMVNIIYIVAKKYVYNCICKSKFLNI